ncbi:MAG: MFS transporter [Bifidobacteriaceae bacterium]|jgi:CP family cyanate transporter-like MFS transporter|nr:MFS transporter [Bifidobacteriaceae bacterium]
MSEEIKDTKKINSTIFLIFVIVISANLRMSLTAVSPLFPTIQSSWSVNGAFTSLLVTIPLLCFAAGATVTPAIVRRIGLKSTLILMAALLTGASLVRPTTPLLLIVGTVFVGLSIACLNVALPILIATLRPQDATKLTSYYSLSQSLFSAIASAAVIPSAAFFGWQSTLRLFAIPALVVAIFAAFLPLPARREEREQEQEPAADIGTTREAKNRTSVFRDPAAWLLAGFMALQSLIFYSLSTWLPSIFEHFDASSQNAGFLLSLFQLIGIPAALLVSLIPNQKIILGLNAAGYLVGLAALPWGTAGLWIAAIGLGFTAALIFTQAMALITSSSPDPDVVAARSGFAQAVGYLIAASGPVIFGWLPTVLPGGWNSTLWVFGAVMVVTIFLGAGAISRGSAQSAL